MDTTNARAAFAAIKTDLSARFRRREAVIECMMASCLADELMILIGPRGEAKTAIVEAFGGYIADGQHFSVGLAKSSTPDEILGGVDVPALSNQGIYRRNTSGYLPEATTFLLDEGFKSNNPTLQALLRMLSEREFQGQPLRSVFGALASNELPAELRGQKNGKAADLGPFEDSLLAFWDRFFHKIEVAPLPCGSQDWQDVVFSGCRTAVAPVSVTVAEIQAMQAEVHSVTIPDAVKASIIQITEALAAAEQPVRVSTRTWVKAVKILKAHAYLAGRDEVTRRDLKHLVHGLWTTPDQIALIGELLAQSNAPELAEAQLIADEVAALAAALAEGKIKTDSGRLAIAESRQDAAQISQCQVLFASSYLDAKIKEIKGLSAAQGVDPEDVAEINALLDGVAATKKEAAQTVYRLLSGNMGSV